MLSWHPRQSKLPHSTPHCFLVVPKRSERMISPSKEYLHFKMGWGGIPSFKMFLELRKHLHLQNGWWKCPSAWYEKGDAEHWDLEYDTNQTRLLSPASSEADLPLLFVSLFSAGKSWGSQPFLPVFPGLLFCPFGCAFCSADFSLSAASLWLHFHRCRSGLTGPPLWAPPSLPPRQGLTFLLGIWGSGSPRALEKRGGQAATAPPTAWAAGTP